MSTVFLLYSESGYLLSYGTLGIRKVFSARAGIENFCSLIKTRNKKLKKRLNVVSFGAGAVDYVISL